MYATADMSERTYNEQAQRIAGAEVVMEGSALGTALAGGLGAAGAGYASGQTKGSDVAAAFARGYADTAAAYGQPPAPVAPPAPPESELVTWAKSTGGMITIGAIALLLVAAGAVLLGTLYPLVLDALGLLSAIDRSLLPNWGNLLPDFLGQPFDPENWWSVPWQWGMTGLAVRTDLVPALALGAEPPEPGIMDRPPRKASEHAITPALLASAATLRCARLSRICTLD